MLLLSCLAVAAVVAQERLEEADAADVDEDMGLDEELNVLMAEEEEATVMDEEQSDEKEDQGKERGKGDMAEMDANISFQVSNESEALN